MPIRNFPIQSLSMKPSAQLLLLLYCSLPTFLHAQPQLSAVVPEVIPKGVFFGMPLENFRQAVELNQLTRDTTDEYRWTYFHEHPTDSIEGIMYFIDNQLAHQPLYEIAIAYGDQEQAYAAAVALFGEPNFLNKQTGETNEWRFTIPGLPDIWVWVVKGNLVVIANIPGTEWGIDWYLY